MTARGNNIVVGRPDYLINYLAAHLHSENKPAWVHLGGGHYAVSIENPDPDDHRHVLVTPSHESKAGLPVWTSHLKVGCYVDHDDEGEVRDLVRQDEVAVIAHSFLRLSGAPVVPRAALRLPQGVVWALLGVNPDKEPDAPPHVLRRSDEQSLPYVNDETRSLMLIGRHRSGAIATFDPDGWRFGDATYQKLILVTQDGAILL